MRGSQDGGEDQATPSHPRGEGLSWSQRKSEMIFWPGDRFLALRIAARPVLAVKEESEFISGMFL